MRRGGNDCEKPRVGSARHGAAAPSERPVRSFGAARLDASSGDRTLEIIVKLSLTNDSIRSLALVSILESLNARRTMLASATVLKVCEPESNRPKTSIAFQWTRTTIREWETFIPLPFFLSIDFSIHSSLCRPFIDSHDIPTHSKAY